MTSKERNCADFNCVQLSAGWFDRSSGVIGSRRDNWCFFQPVLSHFWGDTELIVARLITLKEVQITSRCALVSHKSLAFVKTRLIYGATTNRVEEGKTEGEGNCRVSCGLECCTKLEIGSKKVDSPCSNKRRVRNRRPSESKLTRVLFREYSQMELASRTGRAHPGSEGSLIFLFTNAMRGSVISMYREEKEIRTLSIDE